MKMSHDAATRVVVKLIWTLLVLRMDGIGKIALMSVKMHIAHDGIVFTISLALDLGDFGGQLDARTSQQGFPEERRVSKMDQLASSINSDGGLVEKALKRYNGYICKRDIMPKLNRETRKRVINLTNQAAQIKVWSCAYIK